MGRECPQRTSCRKGVSPEDELLEVSVPRAKTTGGHGDRLFKGNERVKSHACWGVGVGRWDVCLMRSGEGGLRGGRLGGGGG